MSRLELLADLGGARPAAPPELRERVREIAAGAEPPARRSFLTRRRALVALVAAAVAAAAAVGVVERGGTPEQATVTSLSEPATKEAATPQPGAGSLDRSAAPPASGTRLQDYDATLSLRVRDADALSAATKRALAVVRSLGGFASVVSLSVDGTGGDATLRVRVPATKVGDALQRLSALGTITGEQVTIQDLQTGVNALDRRIARLQRQLAALRKQEQTPAVKRKIASLTGQVQRLQRSRADTVRQARLATIELQLTTRTPPAPPKPETHGPLHGAIVALTWLGIGALYALVVGGPVVLLAAALWLAARALRRRSERRLLERV